MSKKLLQRTSSQLLRLRIGSGIISALSFVLLPVFPVRAQEKTLVSDGLGLGSDNFSGYLNNLFELALLIGAILAVLIIASAGLQYMSTDAVSGKTTSRERIFQAVVGLLMLLGIWIFFAEINPNILKTDLSLDTVRVQGRGAQSDPAREAELRKQLEAVIQRGGEKRAAEAKNILSNAGPIISGPLVNTGAGILPNYYAKVVAKQNGRVQCPVSASRVYTSAGPTGNAGICSVGGGGTFNSDTQACCVYNLNFSALSD
ncbi:hypothetical protein CL652_00635 [bacterium]|nr:hypothetical protein [bacterium]|tara:strand:+ start:582 stop:1358 length:777 start_codon:yes stop_codon:yes gene_type:complete